MKKKAVIISQYFNLIHKGYLGYFNKSKALTDELVVIVSNDYQRVFQGSKKCQKEDE